MPSNMLSLNPEQIKRYIDDVNKGLVIPKAGQTYVEAWLEREEKRRIDKTLSSYR